MSRRFAPATQRNRGPILAVLHDVLPAEGIVVEVASGTGEHIIHFAEMLPNLMWQPSDPDPTARDSIAAWLAYSAHPNINAPLDLDVHRTPWPVEGASALICINMLHIAPWSACTALFRGGRSLLPQQGVLYLYGPYMLGGKHTAASNANFDRDLKSRDPNWGVRELDEVETVARATGFELSRVVPMPANNLSLVFHKHG